MRTIRGAVFAVGLVVGVYGAYLLLTDLDTAQLVSVAKWFLGGVIVHDGLISAAVVGLALLIRRFVPAAARAPIVVGAVILGSVTVVGLPVLNRMGANTANSTLLDRNYWVGWLVVVLLVVVSVVVACVVRARAKSE